MKKKILSLALALAMCLSLTVPIFAGDWVYNYSANGYTDPTAENVEFSVAPIGAAKIRWVSPQDTSEYTAYVFDQDCIVTRKDGLPFKRFNLPPMYGDAGYSVPMGAFEQWAYVEEEWAWVEAGFAGIRADRDNGWAYQFAPGEDERDWSPFMMSKKGLDTVFPYEDTEYGVTGTVLEYRPLSAQPTVPTVGSFNDVKENDWFSKQVQWAVEQEITSGTTASTFSPKKDCTVAEILMFLYKAEGDPKFTAGQPYDNVAGSEWYAGAALWAYGEGLVSGGEFQAGAPCTRAQIVTFLYAALAK